MTCFELREGTSFFAPSQISSRPSDVTDVSVLSSMTSALGPINAFPCTVVATRIPLLISVGIGKRTELISNSSRSKMKYSPRRGEILKSGRTPALCMTMSEYKPAELIAQRHWKSP